MTPSVRKYVFRVCDVLTEKLKNILNAFIMLDNKYKFSYIGRMHDHLNSNEKTKRQIQITCSF